jgi:Raf kinase inhibitor-like YbhB/YbcL family protein
MEDQTMIKLTSSAFNDGEMIPRRFTCDGDDINPPLTVSGIPLRAKSLALIVDDPDAPGGTWTHWIVWDIDPATTGIHEGSVPPGAVQGRNDFGRRVYGGPCPPTGVHRYFFRLYVLDAQVVLNEGASRMELEKAMYGHVLAEVELMGKYQRGQ